MVDRNLLIVQQTLFYEYKGDFYSMPHVERTLQLIARNFSTVSVITIVTQAIPPSGYIKVNSEKRVIPLFYRLVEEDKIK